MDDHPYGEEELSKKWPPWLIPAVYGIWNSSHNAYQVDDEHSCWWDEERCPFEHIELCKVPIIIRCLWSDSEVGVNPSKHFQQPLEDGKEMGWCTTNDPELLVSPPVFNTDTTPSKLKYSSSENGDEEENKPHASKVTYLHKNCKKILTECRWTKKYNMEKIIILK